MGSRTPFSSDDHAISDTAVTTEITNAITAAAAAVQVNLDTHTAAIALNTAKPSFAGLVDNYLLKSVSETPTTSAFYQTTSTNATETRIYNADGILSYIAARLRTVFSGGVSSLHITADYGEASRGLTLTSQGAIGVNGAFGSAGQILTSGGNSGQVVWSTPATHTPDLFMVHGTSTQSTLNSGAKLTVWLTPSIDTASSWDSSNHEYVIGTAGYWRLDAHVQFIAQNASIRGATAYITVNDGSVASSTVILSDQTGSPEYQGASPTCIYNCAVGDKIAVKAQAAQPTYLYGFNCRLSCQFLRAV